MDEHKELLTIIEVKEKDFLINKEVDLFKHIGCRLRLGVIGLE